MIIEKKSNDFLVVDNGVISSFDKDANISFKLNIEEEVFAIVFSFVQDNQKEGFGLRTKVESKNKIIVECINFDNPVGTGTVTPIELATINNKKFYVNFNVRKINNGPHMLSYTFYIER